MLSVQERVDEHLREARSYFPQSRIVGIFLQGSQNYGLDIPTSDVDTKLIVVPTFEEICFNRKPHSTTHVRENNEHIDFKDIRLMLQTYRKQNLNFIETLFTEYKYINPLYYKNWSRLIDARERIARYNPYTAVKAMKGIALEKFHAMEHEYPSKVEIIAKYGYDCKQLHHLLRVEEFLERYINGEWYANCLRPRDPEYLKAVKQNLYNLDEAREKAVAALNHIEIMVEEFCSKTPNECDPRVDELLDDVQRNIMRKALRIELE